MVYQLAGLRLNLCTTVTSSGGGDPTFESQIWCPFKRNTSTVASGFSISMSRSSSGTAVTCYLGYNASTTVPGSTLSNGAATTARMEFTNLTWYSAFNWAADQIDIYLNGTLTRTITGATNNTASVTEPAGISSFGAGPMLWCTGSIPPNYPSSPAFGDYFSSTDSVTVTASGGIEFKIRSTDSWTTWTTTTTNPPSSYSFGSVPPPFGLTLSSSYSAANSNSLSCQYEVVNVLYDVYQLGGWRHVDSTFQTKATEIGFINNEKPQLIRYNSEFYCYAQRSSASAVEYSIETFAKDLSGYPGVPSGSGAGPSYVTVLAGVASGVSGLGPTKGTFETEYLDRDHPCLARSAASKYRIIEVVAAVDPSYQQTVQSESVTWQYPGRLAPTTDWSSMPTEFENRVGNRWDRYSIPSFTPTVSSVTQGTGFSTSFRMWQDGSSKIGRVMLGNLDAQIGVAYGRVYESSGNTSASYSQSSSALISAPSGSITFSSTGFTATSGVVRIQLASLTTSPYLFGALADSLSISVTGTNLKYYLRNRSASYRSVTPSGGTISLLVQGNKLPAGNWSYNWGSRAFRVSGSTVLNDPYPDIPAHGVSSSVNANTLDSIGSRTGDEGSWDSLVITGSGSITCAYPTLARSAGVSVWVVSPELFILGNGTRFIEFGTGGTCWMTSATSPGVQEPGLVPTMGDWLPYVRLLNGIAPSSGITADYAVINTSDEGQTHTGVRTSTVLPLSTTKALYFKSDYQKQYNSKFGFVNMVSGMTSLGSSVTQDRWEYAYRGSRIFGYGQEIGAVSGSTTISSSIGSTGILYQSNMDPAYNFSDGRTVYLKAQGQSLSLVRPVFGFVGGYGPAPGRHKVCTSVSRDGLILVSTWDSSASVTNSFLDQSKTTLSSSVVSGVEIANGFWADEPYYLSFNPASSGSLILRGKNWNMITSYSTSNGSCPSLAIFSDGEFRIYWLEGSLVYCARTDPSGTNLLGRTAVTGVPAVDEMGLSGVQVVLDSTGQPYTVLSVLVAGVLSIYTSYNGKDFS